MNSNIVFWNVRGLNDGSKRIEVCNLLHHWKADIVCLQETKIAGVTPALICSLWRGKFVNWICLDAIRASGGIILLWDNRVVEKVETVVGSHTVSCKFREVSSGFEWAFSSVYSPNRSVERWLLWEELSGIQAWWSVLWCVCADFNIVPTPLNSWARTAFLLI